MKRFPVLFLVVIVILTAVLAAGGSYLYYSHHKKSVSYNSSSTTVTSKTAAKTPIQSETPSYYVGDTQTEGNLSIKLDSTSLGAPSMGTMPANTENFVVNVTITNNGTQTFVTPDAFGSVSSVYTQIGTDTTTGKHVPSENSQGDSNACFGGGEIDIAAGQTVNGCILFLIPTNVSVDTYFYNNLKWYL